MEAERLAEEGIEGRKEDNYSDCRAGGHCLKFSDVRR